LRLHYRHNRRGNVVAQTYEGHRKLYDRKTSDGRHSNWHSDDVGIYRNRINAGHGPDRIRKGNIRCMESDYVGYRLFALCVPYGAKVQCPWGIYYLWSIGQALR